MSGQLSLVPAEPPRAPYSTRRSRAVRATLRGFVAGRLCEAWKRAKAAGIPFDLYDPAATGYRPAGGGRGRYNPTLEAAVDRLLSPEYFTELCPVLLIALVYAGRAVAIGKAFKRDNAASLDRIVPELGYVWSNIRWVSWRANSLKKDANPVELILVGEDAKRMRPHWDLGRRGRAA